MKIITTDEIIKKVNSIKADSKKVYTNSNLIFSMYPDRKWYINESHNSLVIIKKENEINRIIFFTTDWIDLKQMIKSIAGENIIEVVAKDANKMKNEITELGFKKLITQIRVSSNDISKVINSNSLLEQYYNSKIGNVASESDLEQINEILWNTFDTRASHLDNTLDISNQIKKNDFYIHKNSSNKIDMLIQCNILTKSLYFNQVVNKGDKRLFYALTLNILKKYCEQGGRYAYAWVNEGNIASFKYFEKLSLHEDGLYNSIYIMK